MSWITGSEPVGYLGLFDKLMKAATGQGATAVSIVGGGTAYTVGDILTVTGGTSSFAAKIRVVAVSLGVITSAVISEGGAYTSNPSNPVAVTGGTGTGATFNLTFASNGWTLKRRSVQAVSATVGAGGTGGTNGTRTVTVTTVSAIGVTTSAQFSVTISGGAITAVLSLVTAGLYERPANLAPPSLTSTEGVTDAGLTGAALNITWAYPTTQEQVMILEGSGGGSDSILVGLRSYQAANGANTAFNWGLFGFTAYNNGLTFNAQAGISPGDTTTPSNTQGAYVPLHNNGASFPIDFWFSVTPNRIVGVAKVRNATVTHYSSFHLGFINRFGAPSEWPYPIVIAGSTTRVYALFNSTILTYVSSIAELISAGALIDGPAFYRRSDGVWVGVSNSRVANDETSPTRSAGVNKVAYPLSLPNAATINVDGDDNISGDASTNGGVSFAAIAPALGVPGTATKTIHPTPNTAGALRRLYPLTFTFAESGPPIEKDIFGEYDGVFWVSAADVTTPLTSEDFITAGTTRYRVFKSGNRALDYTYFAVEEK